MSRDVVVVAALVLGAPRPARARAVRARSSTAGGARARHESIHAGAPRPPDDPREEGPLSRGSAWPSSGDIAQQRVRRPTMPRHERTGRPSRWRGRDDADPAHAKELGCKVSYAVRRIRSRDPRRGRDHDAAALQLGRDHTPASSASSLARRRRRRAWGSRWTARRHRDARAHHASGPREPRRRAVAGSRRRAYSVILDQVTKGVRCAWRCSCCSPVPERRAQ